MTDLAQLAELDRLIAIRKLTGQGLYIDENGNEVLDGGGTIPSVAEIDAEIAEQAEKQTNPLIISSSLNNQVVNAAGVAMRFNVTKKVSDVCHIDDADDTKIVFDRDVLNASLGGFITVQSSGQRFHGVVRYFINSTTTGINRGFSYLRNAGNSHDFASKEIATQYMDFAQGDELQIYVFSVEGAGYTQVSDLNGTIRGTASEFWVKG